MFAADPKQESEVSIQQGLAPALILLGREHGLQCDWARQQASNFAFWPHSLVLYKDYILKTRQNLIAAISDLLADKSIVTPLLQNLLIRSLLDSTVIAAYAGQFLPGLLKQAIRNEAVRRPSVFSSYVSSCFLV